MNSKTLAIAAISVLTLVACKKDEEAKPNPAPGPGATTSPVNLSINFMNGTQPFDAAQTFVDGDGRNVRITKLRFYAHDFHLTDDDGSTVGEFHDRIILADVLAANNTFSLGEMDPGHVHQVELAVGLDSASSYGYPDQLTAPAPLNDADMPWAWNTMAGRMFIKLEGFVDANDNDTQDDGEGFQYHAIGAAMAPIATHWHIHHDAEAGNAFNINLKVDMPTLVNGMALTGMNHNAGPENQQLLQNLVVALMPM